MGRKHAHSGSRVPLYGTCLVVLAFTAICIATSPARFSDLTRIFLFGLVATVTLAFFWLLRGEDSLLDPAVMCMSILFVQAVIYPCFIMMTGNTRDSFYVRNVDQYLAWAYLVWLLVIACFVLGVTLVPYRLRMPVLNHIVNQGRSPYTVSLVLLGISLAGTAIISVTRGGIWTWTDPAAAADGIRLNRGLGVFQPLAHCSYVAVAYLGWVIFLHRKRDTMLLLWGLVVSMVAAAPYLMMGRRSVLVFHLILLFLPALRRLHNHSIRFLLPCVLLCVFAFDLASSSLRSGYYQAGSLDLSTLRELRLTETTAPMSFNHLELTAALMSHIDAGDFTILYGATYLSGALNWLPRWLFPDKGWTAGPLLADSLGWGYSFDDRHRSSSITPGLVVESVMNFGIFLAPVFAFAVGALLSWISARMASYMRTAVGATLWSLFYFHFCYALVASEFGQLINRVVCLSLGVAVLAMLTRVGDGRHRLFAEPVTRLMSESRST